MTNPRPYRGKTKDGKWVYGHYYIKHRHLIKPRHIISEPHPMGDEYEVIPSTVSQSTGEYDDNKKEIYKGDLFRTSDKHGFASNCIAEVVFVDGAFAVQLYRGDELEVGAEILPHFKRLYRDSYKVIGDVYDNGDLLNDSENTKTN